MSASTEAALVFSCAGETLVGVLSRPASASGVGIVIVVGGPQYRIGSHRQFVLLARAFAQAGHAVLRFDYRSMGDGSGERRDFMAVQDDIAAAIDALQRECPTVDRVVLWGLCDGASAALLYAHATADRRIGGLCLLNPWVRSAASQARTQIRHYYVQRALQPEFWRKLLSGGVAAAAVRDLVRNLRTARARPTRARASAMGFQDRMAAGWRDFEGDILLMLSELDYTAKEFLEYVQMHPAWDGALAHPRLVRRDLAGADHTFSNADDRTIVAQATLDWLARLEAPAHSGNTG